MRINASEFKARCLSILDEVARTGEQVTVLKRGKPVARLLPPVEAEAELPQLELRGAVVIRGISSSRPWRRMPGKPSAGSCFGTVPIDLIFSTLTF